MYIVHTKNFNNKVLKRLLELAKYRYYKIELSILSLPNIRREKKVFRLVKVNQIMAQVLILVKALLQHNTGYQTYRYSNNFKIYKTVATFCY